VVVNSTINITALQHIHSFSEMFIFVNDASGNLFMKLAMVAVFFVILMIQKRFGFLQSLTLSSAVCFILSLMLSVAGFNLSQLIFAFLVVMLASGFFLALDSQKP
jgi:hypothetical protein